MTKTWVRVLLWAAVLTTMAMIFGFSGQSGESSLGLSHAIVQPMVNWAASLWPALSAQALDSLYWTLQTIVRKGAHLAEYAWLGFLLRLLCQSYTLPRAGLIAWAAGTMYAVTDEVHQMYIDARSPQLSDVLIDSLGVLIGASLALWMLMKWTRRKSS